MFKLSFMTAPPRDIEFDLVEFKEFDSHAEALGVIVGFILDLWKHSKNGVVGLVNKNGNTEAYQIPDKKLDQ